MKRIIMNILTFMSSICLLTVQFGGVALHLYTVLLILGMHGFLLAVLAFCLPIASQIYCFIASIVISGYFLNTYTIWILLYIAVWVALLVIGGILSTNK